MVAAFSISEEATLLDAVHTLGLAEDRAAEDAERTEFFAEIAAELAEEGTADDDPSPPC